jgi:hypothetical protein
VLELSKETTLAFDRRMERAGVPEQERPAYRKWVQFYLDFCQKYGHPPQAESSLGPLLAKLESKNQSDAQFIGICFFKADATRSGPGALTQEKASPNSAPNEEIEGNLSHTQTERAPEAARNVLPIPLRAPPF